MDATVPATRAGVQGSVDVLVALSGAGGGVLSGVVVAGYGFATLSLAGGLLALLLIPVLFWANTTRAADASDTAEQRRRMHAT